MLLLLLLLLQLSVHLASEIAAGVVVACVSYTPRFGEYSVAAVAAAAATVAPAVAVAAGAAAAAAAAAVDGILRLLLPFASEHCI